MKAKSGEFVVVVVGTAGNAGRWWVEGEKRIVWELDRHEREKVVSQTTQIRNISKAQPGLCEFGGNAGSV